MKIKRDYCKQRKPKKVCRVVEMNERQMVENNKIYFKVLSKEDDNEEDECTRDDYVDDIQNVIESDDYEITNEHNDEEDISIKCK